MSECDVRECGRGCVRGAVVCGVLRVTVPSLKHLISKNSSAPVKQKVCPLKLTQIFKIRGFIIL